MTQLKCGVAAIMFVVSTSVLPSLVFADDGVLEINGVVGYLEVRTSPRASLSVQVVPGRKLSATAQRDGDTISINGSERGGTSNSCTMIGPPNARVEQITIAGRQYLPIDLPRIIVTGPDTIKLDFNGSTLRGTAGNVGDVAIQQTGCTNFSVGNVSGNLDINVAGSGTTAFGAVQGTTSINIAGSGNVELRAAGDAVDVNIQGSGNVNIGGGRSGLSVNIAGSGGLRHGGTVIDPEINIAGSGSVTVARVEGESEVMRSGSGSFRVR